MYFNKNTLEKNFGPTNPVLVFKAKIDSCAILSPVLRPEDVLRLQMGKIRKKYFSTNIRFELTNVAHPQNQKIRAISGDQDWAPNPDNSPVKRYHCTSLVWLPVYLFCRTHFPKNSSPTKSLTIHQLLPCSCLSELFLPCTVIECFPA